MNRFLLFLEKYTGACVLFLLGLTLRYRIIDDPHKKKAIYSFWHRNIIPLFFHRKFEKIVVLISSSLDGELIAGPCQVLGYQTIRGSSTRQGTKAMKEMIMLSQKYSLAITPDGPKGPAEKIKKGLLHLAYFTKLPIITVQVNVARKFVFNSWDRLVLPLPFSRVTITYGKPIFIEKKEDLEKMYDIIQIEMNK